MWAPVTNWKVSTDCHISLHSEHTHTHTHTQITYSCLWSRLIHYRSANSSSLVAMETLLHSCHSIQDLKSTHGVPSLRQTELRTVCLSRACRHVCFISCPLHEEFTVWRRRICIADDITYPRHLASKLLLLF